MVKDTSCRRIRCKEDCRIVYVDIARKGHDLLDRLDMVHSLLAHMSELDLGEINRLLVKARKSE